jgi:hypothetical protein
LIVTQADAAEHGNHGTEHPIVPCEAHDASLPSQLLAFSFCDWCANDADDADDDADDDDNNDHDDAAGCRQGDMILWDNRTSHCNCPGTIPPHHQPAARGANATVSITFYPVFTVASKSMLV